MKEIKQQDYKLTEVDALHLAALLLDDPEDGWTYEAEEIPDHPGPYNFRVKVFDEEGVFVGYL